MEPTAASQASPWRVRRADPGQLQALSAASLPPLLEQLLSLRGIATADAAKRFLEPALRDLPDPWLLKDCQRAAEIVADALQAEKTICIYGDYDADGISAAALLHCVLRELGGGDNVQVFLPDRIKDGYGLNGERLAELLDRGAELFVSVDCGATAWQEVAAVRARGGQFVVIDHHTLGQTPVEADAFVNPKQAGCDYTDPHLSAVGLAFVVAQGLRRVLAGRGVQKAAQFDLKTVLEFAALGTVADVVQLKDVNRTLVWHGLRRLGTTSRPGIRALARHLPLGGVQSDRIGFQLAPKINAAGRIADAHTAFRLLVTADPQVGEDLAAQLDVENNRRKDMTLEVTQQALAQAQALPCCDHAVVVAGRDWHQGVVGIAAAKLAEQLGVPAIALAIDADGMARGSARSAHGYDLVEGLRRISSGLFERFGGHAYAAGMTLRADRVPELYQRLRDDAAQHLPPLPRSSELLLDAELPLDRVDLELVALLERLEPYGKGNAKPLFLIRDLELAKLDRVGKDQQWMRGVLAVPGTQPLYARAKVDCFGPASAFAGLMRGQRVDAAGSVDRNVWQGKHSVQLRVEAMRPASANREGP